MRQPLILVVDDDPAIVHIVRDALHNNGYAVIDTGRDDEALTLLEDEQPDLIVLDLMIPGIDGLAVLNRLRAIRQLPVILLTDHAEDHVMSEDGGFEGYLTPPFSTDDLAALVARLLPYSVEGMADSEGRPARHAPEIPFDLAWHGEQGAG